MDIIVYRQNKFFYIEGIEEPKKVIGFEPEEQFQERLSKFKERLSTEGVEIEGTEKDIIKLFSKKYYLKLKKELDFIEYSKEVEIRDSKAYLK